MLVDDLFNEDYVPQYFVSISPLFISQYRQSKYFSSPTSGNKEASIDHNQLLAAVALVVAFLTLPLWMKCIKRSTS
jgi:hypothetical protein